MRLRFTARPTTGGLAMNAAIGIMSADIPNTVTLATGQATEALGTIGDAEQSRRTWVT
jgi:hypothetical protein